MKLTSEQLRSVRHKARDIVSWASAQDDYTNRWFEDEVGRLYIRVGIRSDRSRDIQVLEFANLEIRPEYRHRGAMSAIMAAALDLAPPFGGLYLEGLDIRRNARWHRSLLDSGWFEAPRPSRATWFSAGLPDLGARYRSLGLPFAASDAYRQRVARHMAEAAPAD